MGSHQTIRELYARAEKVAHATPADEAALASFALGNVNAALNKTAFTFFGPNATQRMQAAYNETPTKVYTPPSTRGTPGSPYRSNGVVNPVNTADVAAHAAAGNLNQSVPRRGGIRGAWDALTGKRVQDLRGAEDKLHSVASMMHPDALTAHAREVSGAIQGAEKSRNAARAVAGGAAALGTAVAGGVAAHKHQQQVAANALRKNLIGGAVGGTLLGVGALGAHHLLTHNKPKQQPEPQVQR